MVNTHQPLVEEKIGKHLARAVELLRFLGDEVNASDLEQTAQNIKDDFDEARKEEKSKYANNLIGKYAEDKSDKCLHKIVDVILFEKDVFGQGAYAVATEDGKYLYEYEIELIDHEGVASVSQIVRNGKSEYDVELKNGYQFSTSGTQRQIFSSVYQIKEELKNIAYCNDIDEEIERE